MSQHPQDHGSTASEHEETIDVEEYGKRGEQPPKAHRYRIRIDKAYYVVEQSSMSGREILALDGKTPDKYYLDEKLHGAPPARIGPDDVVEFSTKGIERFMTLPRTETEGRPFPVFPWGAR